MTIFSPFVPEGARFPHLKRCILLTPESDRHPLVFQDDFSFPAHEQEMANFLALHPLIEELDWDLNDWEDGEEEIRVTVQPDLLPNLKFWSSPIEGLPEGGLLRRIEEASAIAGNDTHWPRRPIQKLNVYYPLQELVNFKCLDHSKLEKIFLEMGASREIWLKLAELAVQLKSIHIPSKWVYPDPDGQDAEFIDPLEDLVRLFLFNPSMCKSNGILNLRIRPWIFSLAFPTFVSFMSSTFDRSDQTTRPSLR